MKFSEMNKREQKAFMNIKYAADWLIGELENICMDNPSESEEYKNAEALLENHEALVKELYNMATSEIYGVGSCCFDSRACEKELRDINFLGKEWLMERCEKRISKMEKEGFCY